MIVIGAGRIGTGLAAGAEAHGLPIGLVDRSAGWERLDEPAGDPVILAVRNDDLREVVPRIPAHRRPDLVLVQNGAIRELLAELGLAGATRGLLYVLAARRGQIPIPGARNVFHGPRAEQTARWLERIGLPSEAVDGPRFAEFELEKLLWLACNGVLCEVRSATVGEIAERHREELEALVEELAPIGWAAWGMLAGVRLRDGRVADVRAAGEEPAGATRCEPVRAQSVVEGMVAYSRAIPDYRASVKEWPWRNGWLRAEARRHRLPTPIHDRLLARIGHPEGG